jgi:FlaA1/EpsC-like NDP-sugar epimerase
VPKRYVGLRPGEKLHESLWEHGESVGRSEHGKVFIVNGSSPAVAEVEALVATLEALAMSGNVEGVLETMGEAVPSYRPATSMGDLAPAVVAASGA